MLKKILFAVEFILIACILFACVLSEDIPEDDIPAISDMSDISETTTEEETTEIVTEVETTEFIEITTVPPADPPTTETEEETTAAITADPEIIIDYPRDYDEDGEIFEIEEYDGPEKFAGLYKVIAKYGKGVSVFYRDIKSGEEYFYNPDKNYFIASLIKAPYVVYVYRCILADENGEIKLAQKYEYLESDYREGTGKIKNMEFGTELTLAQLISYAIRWSDNVAMDKLRKLFPVSGFKEWAIDIELPHIDDINSSAVNGVICAKCAAAYIEAVYNFIEENNPYSSVLKEHMLNTINPMIYANYPFVRKYGWATDSFHDMGIVYNEKRPYLIAILCDNGYGDFPMFREISLEIQKYNESKLDKSEESE